jgi:hypothetical protein
MYAGERLVRVTFLFRRSFRRGLLLPELDSANLGGGQGLRPHGEAAYQQPFGVTPSRSSLARILAPWQGKRL